MSADDKPQTRRRDCTAFSVTARELSIYKPSFISNGRPFREFAELTSLGEGDQGHTEAQTLSGGLRDVR